jgi:hypothetical protein
MHLAWADSCRLTGQGGWPTHTMILGGAGGRVPHPYSCSFWLNHKTGCPILDAVSSRQGWETTKARHRVFCFSCLTGNTTHGVDFPDHAQQPHYANHAKQRLHLRDDAHGQLLVKQPIVQRSLRLR